MPQRFDLERALGPNVLFMDLNDLPATSSTNPTPTILIIGASRGLGHAMAAEFLKNGWNVVGTVRAGAGRTLLHDLADAFPGRLEIELLDINEPAQIASLRARQPGLSMVATAGDEMQLMGAAVASRMAGWPTFTFFVKVGTYEAGVGIFVLASADRLMRTAPLLRKHSSDSLPRRTVTADLVVPTFTKNVKVGQPAKPLYSRVSLAKNESRFFGQPG